MTFGTHLVYLLQITSFHAHHERNRENRSETGNLVLTSNRIKSPPPLPSKEIIPKTTMPLLVNNALWSLLYIS